MAILTIPAEVNQLPSVNKFIKECMPLELESRLQAVELAVEELLINIFQYAYGENKGQAEIACHVATRENGTFFHIVIRDWGRPFNPFKVPEPEINLDIESRPIGGLGIHLVRTLADSYSYERVNETNLVKLFFSVTSAQR